MTISQFSFQKNTRFQYKLVKNGGRASEFENAIEWLTLSGIVSQVYKAEHIRKPLENYRDIDSFKIYYWESERGAEIDFIIQREGQLVPIEVKSADNTKAKSLQSYMRTNTPAYAIKLSARNFSYDNNIKVVPLYTAFCL